MELILLMAFALASDIKTYKIKNLIIIAFITIGLISNFIIDGLTGLTTSAIATALPACILIILFALNMLGAGDIKLFCAIGAISGVKFVLYCIVYSFLAGGIIAFIIMLANRNFIQRSKYLFNYIKACILTLSLQPYTDFNVKNDGSKFHFSYAIACGVVMQMLTVAFG